MNVWEMLGIEPTKDIAVIKKAYAARSKHCHPEEYPEEYQKLRSAYKTALQYAKSSGENTVLVVSSAIYEHGSEVSMSKSSRSVSSAMQVEKPRQTKPEPELYFKLPKESEPGQTERKPETCEFHYEELDQYLSPALVDEFYHEFEYIQRNPFLINRPEAWRYLCEKPRREELFANAQFREELALRLCLVPRMRSKAFIFWDELFARYDEKIGQMEEWQKKRRNCAWEDTFARAESKADSKMRAIHSDILANLHKKGYATLKTRGAIEEYLNYYFLYMNNGYDQSQVRRKAGNQRSAIYYILLALFVLSVITSVREYIKKERALSQNTSQIEEQLFIRDMPDLAENAKRQNEIIDQTLEHYEAWLEGQESTEGY